ncbi:hypothetical protein FRB94_002180 [Tulasnella sp. JGI-2019a]|nr:hypothetical protein FRB93_003949 [Tulasnella sp. JGI-2019a]KAG9004640.1 hypothetical protein FRB94_002180 [Tulasnella sp. JGI-2019a]
MDQFSPPMPASRDPLLQDVHGGSFSAVNQGYTFPVDNEDRERLNLTHENHRFKAGGLYRRPDDVRRILAVRSNYTPTVLDIGTGSGAWAVDMTREFPHAQVLGIDLASPILTTIPPPNCRFESHDINHGLDQFGISFDLIHIRACDQGIASQSDLVTAVANVLRPGGLFLSLVAPLATFDEKDGLITAEDEGEPVLLDSKIYECLSTRSAAPKPRFY